MKPELIADLYLYPTEEGGPKVPMADGIGCPSYSRKGNRENGWTCFPKVGDVPLAPGQRRRVMLSFFSAEAVEEMRRTGTIYLWNSRYIGEATIVFDGATLTR